MHLLSVCGWGCGWAYTLWRPAVLTPLAAGSAVLSASRPTCLPPASGQARAAAGILQAQARAVLGTRKPHLKPVENASSLRGTGQVSTRL